MRVAVVCMKWGTKYPAHYVNRLRNMVARHLNVPHDFICYTDDASGIDQHVTVRPFSEKWAGFIRGTRPWCEAKLELFKPGAFEPGRQVLYLDLDIVIIRSIDFLFDTPADFVIIRDPRHTTRFNGSLFVLRAGTCADIYERYAADPDRIMKSFKGDQEFLFDCRPNAPTIPIGRVVSFKLEAGSNAWSWLARIGLKGLSRRLPAPSWLSTPLPTVASVVIFHGEPNPPDVTYKPFGPYKKAPWIAEHWH